MTRREHLERLKAQRACIRCGAEDAQATSYQNGKPVRRCLKCWTAYYAEKHA